MKPTERIEYALDAFYESGGMSKDYAMNEQLLLVSFMADLREYCKQSNGKLDFQEAVDANDPKEDEDDLDDLDDEADEVESYMQDHCSLMNLEQYELIEYSIRQFLKKREE